MRFGFNALLVHADIVARSLFLHRSWPHLIYINIYKLPPCRTEAREPDGQLLGLLDSQNTRKMRRSKEREEIAEVVRDPCISDVRDEPGNNTDTETLGSHF
jgi:hypothetical protein